MYVKAKARPKPKEKVVEEEVEVLDPKGKEEYDTRYKEKEDKKSPNKVTILTMNRWGS